MAVVRTILYSFAMVILLYTTIILLPEGFNMNIMISRVLFVILATIGLKIIKDKWWIKIVASGLGLILFFVIITLQ